MAQFEIVDLSFSYAGTTEKALAGVSLAVERGEFLAVCGATGSGKTTLLRCLKREISPQGELAGEIKYNGVSVASLDEATSARAVGYVTQRPEEQIVTDKVWHELAFGLENLGVPRQSIRRRISEMASYFGIEQWFDRDTHQLSGGQKQLLNLASVMVMNPEILILDEPTAQLDPIAAADFLATVRRLNRDFGLTVIIAEHRLEDVIPDCDRLVLMDKGRVIFCGAPRDAAGRLREHPALLAAMPTAVRIHSALAEFSGDSKCPLSIRDGRDYITTTFGNSADRLPDETRRENSSPALSFSECWFRYGRQTPDVLRGLDLTIYEGELFFILGGNGSGKTTALSAAAGLLRCYSGTIRVFGRKISEYKNQTLYRQCLSMLVQDPQAVFLHSTVREELTGIDTVQLMGYDFSPLMNRHPYDLSGGQQQLLALAKVLATQPRLLLLDEPTKGLDPVSKQMIADVLMGLRDKGVTVVVVSHDVEFAASCADRCALFFRGEAVSVGTPGEFFSENNFYTTAASRMTRGYYQGAVTDSDVITLCRLNGPKG